MKRALTICLLLFGMIAVGKTIDPNEELLDLKKKAAYYEIKVKLESGEITIEQAQVLWKKTLKNLKREQEAK